MVFQYWQYNLEFFINEALGISILDNPLEVIGLAILLAVLVFVVILSRKLLKAYKETNVKPTLFFALAFISFLFAAIFLILEKFSYSTLGSIPLGNLGGVVALNLSGLAIVFVSVFSYYNTFPEQYKLLTIITAAVTFVYVWVLCWAILTGPPVMEIIKFEIVYKELWINILIYCTAIPVVLIGSIIFYYFANKVRSESIANYKRALWFGNGLLFFAVGYISEIAPFFPSELAIPFRSFFLIAVIIIYFCFTKEWTD